MDLRLADEPGWCAARLTGRETWFGLRTEWRYMIVKEYDGQPQIAVDRLMGTLAARDQMREPRDPDYLSGPTFSIRDESTLDRVCRTLLGVTRRGDGRLLRVWASFVGTAARLEIPNGGLDDDELVLLDLAMSLWKSWRCAPPPGAIFTTLDCLCWLPLSVIPDAGAVVRAVAERASRGLSLPMLLDMQRAMCGGDRESFDRMVTNPDPSAPRGLLPSGERTEAYNVHATASTRADGASLSAFVPAAAITLMRLSPESGGHVAGWVEAMAAGPSGIADWLSSSSTPATP